MVNAAAYVGFHPSFPRQGRLSTHRKGGLKEMHVNNQQVVSRWGAAN